MPSIYDLIGMQDPLGDVFPGRRQRGPLLPPIPPEVEDSLLSQLAGGGLSALGYVGSSLDKPGAAVRGLLAGQPGQLANLIPFSDAMGITNEADRVSGRDLLEQYGMLQANTPGLDWGDAAGFAAEVALDPLTYLSLGGSALTKAGRAADMAGTLAGAARGPMGELIQGARGAGIEAGERGLVGIGLPFMQSRAIAGTGPLAQKAAGYLDTAGDWLRYGNPVGLGMGALFDAPSMGQTTRAGQVAAKNIWELERAGETEALRQIGDIAYPMQDKGGFSGAADDIAAQRQFLVDDVPLPDNLQTLQPELEQMRQMVGPDLQSAMLAKGIDVPTLQDEFAQHYFPRVPAEFPEESIASYNSRIMDASDAFTQGRKDVYKNIPGSDDTINSMSIDPQISGATAASATNQLERSKYIREKYLGFKDQDLVDANAKLTDLRGTLALASNPEALSKAQQALEKHQAKLAKVLREQPPLFPDEAAAHADAVRGLQQLVERLDRQIGVASAPDAVKSLTAGVKTQAQETAQLARTFKKSFNLADSIGALDEQHVKNRVPLFPNDPVYDAMKRMVSGHKAMGRATGATQFLGKNARMKPQPGDVPLMEVARKAGLGTQTGQTLTDAGTEMARTKAMVQQALGTDLEDDALEYLTELESRENVSLVDEASKGIFTELQKAMGHKGDPRFAYVPKEAEEIVTKLMKVSASADAAEPVMAFADKFLTAFKVGQLAWPARIVRDLYSGMVGAWFDGGLSWRGVTSGHKIATQGREAVVAGASKISEFAQRGLTDQQATTELLKEMFARKTVGPYGGAWNDINSARVAGTQIAGELPGGIPQTMRSTFVEPWQQKNWWDFRKVRGVGTKGNISKTTEFAYAKNFENMSHYTDTINRAGSYIEYRMQGFAPDVASAKVKLAQVDYSHLTAFEKKYMKRLVPFYTYARRMTPKVIKELTEKPGGRLAQTIRAENMSRDDQFLPPYLAPGLAIRLPEELSSGTGDARYLTSIDLPHEAVFNLFRPSNTLLGTAENTGLGLLGQLNPLIKAPMELATGKQFYSGRDLADLDSRIGRMLNPNAPPDTPILLDQLLMNSPLSRAISTVGTVADPRKGWGGVATNVLSGVKISDVDVERSKDRIARDAIEEMMQGNPNVRSFSNMYVPRELLPTLTPEEQLLMGTYNQIGQRSRERAQQKKQNAGAGRL